MPRDATLTDAQRAALDAGRTSFAPAGPGNDRGLVHGAHSVALISPRATEIADTYRPLIPGYQPHHEPLLQLLALNIARIERTERWLLEKGDFDKTGKPRGPIKPLSTWQAEARRQLTALGMDNTKPGRVSDDSLLRALADVYRDNAMADAVEVEGE